MVNRFIFVFLSIITVSSFLHSQTWEEPPWSNCNYSHNSIFRVEKWLRQSFKEAKDAIKNGRKTNNEYHKLPLCKIQQIENIYQKLKFEYSCSCQGACGTGGTSHEILKGTPFIRICDPLEIYRNKSDSNHPSKVCGCIQGLIVHELVHAAGDLTEQGAVDCSKILYPCAPDAYGDETPDHRNCTCCDRKGE